MPVACFYLPQVAIACERSRLPHLWGEATALADTNQNLLVVSEEALRTGVQVGQSALSARAFCPSLIVLPYDREAYETSLASVWDVFAIESSFVEPVSPELCFVELQGKEVLERAQWLANALATRIFTPVFVGLAESKLVAEQAAKRSSEGKILTIALGEEARFLAPLALEQIAQIDLPTKQRLQRLGVKHFGDLLRLPERELQRQFKQKGWLLQQLAQGRDGDRVRPLYPPPMLEQWLPFEEEVCDRASLEYALRWCAERLSRDLVSRHEFCRSLALQVWLHDETLVQEREKLSLPMDITSDLYRALLRLLSRMRIDLPVVAVEVKASDLGAGGALQMTLPDMDKASLQKSKRARLEKTLVALRRRYGMGAVIPLALLHRAKRIHLWTHPLTKLRNEPVQVVVNGEGEPVRYYRRGRLYSVKRIRDRWKESDWRWDGLSERTAYRIETEPSGDYELIHYEVQWRLGGVSD